MLKSGLVLMLPLFDTGCPLKPPPDKYNPLVPMLDVVQRSVVEDPEFTVAESTVNVSITQATPGY